MKIVTITPKKTFKKAVELKYNLDVINDILDWCPKAKRVADGGLLIPTLDGDMKATTGDWIIQGLNGEFYPCKPDIFEKSYDIVAYNNREEPIGQPTEQQCGNCKNYGTVARPCTKAHKCVSMSDYEAKDGD